MKTKLTAEQLQQFRNHAEHYPVGDTAQLLAHIDWQRQRFAEISQLLENVVAPKTRGQEYWMEEIYRMLGEGGE